MDKHQKSTKYGCKIKINPLTHSTINGD